MSMMHVGLLDVFRALQEAEDACIVLTEEVKRLQAQPPAAWTQSLAVITPKVRMLGAALRVAQTATRRAYPRTGTATDEFKQAVAAEEAARVALNAAIDEMVREWLKNRIFHQVTRSDDASHEGRLMLTVGVVAE